jgi:hypothetical protein
MNALLLAMLVMVLGGCVSTPAQKPVSAWRLHHEHRIGGADRRTGGRGRNAAPANAATLSESCLV